MKSKLPLPGWLAATLGGLTYLLLHTAIEISFPDHWAGSPDRLLGMPYAGWSRLLWIPTALLQIGFVSLFHQLEHDLGKLGKTAYQFTVGGFGLDILGNFIEFWLYGVFLVPLIGAITDAIAYWGVTGDAPVLFRAVAWIALGVWGVEQY